MNDHLSLSPKISSSTLQKENVMAITRRYEARLDFFSCLIMSLSSENLDALFFCYVHCDFVISVFTLLLRFLLVLSSPEL